MEAPHFLELWRLLEAGSAQIAFSLRRFNLAFDRELLDDRIVDLVIAAESLFLGDLGVQDRGELRFRFAIRAAKFIEYLTYSERDVYQVMRRAYDARSAIVHGGSPKDTPTISPRACKYSRTRSRKWCGSVFAKQSRYRKTARGCIRVNIGTIS